MRKAAARSGRQRNRPGQPCFHPSSFLLPPSPFLLEEGRLLLTLNAEDGGLAALVQFDPGRQHGGGRFAQDLAGQGGVVSGPVAGWSIAEDGPPEAGALGKFDVAPDARGEDAGLGPGGIAVPALVKVVLK